MRSRCSGFKKKGFVGDIITLLVLVFILAITILAAYLILNSVNTQFQATDEIGAAGQAIVSDATSKFVNLWDGIFAFLLIGLSLAAVISAYFIDTHPVLMPLLLIVLVAYVFVAAGMANAYYEVEAASAFSSFSESFRMMHYVMNHLGMFAAIFGFMLFIALFAKVNQ